MAPKFIAFAVYIWMLGMLVGVVGDGVALFIEASGHEESTFRYLLSWGMVSVDQDFGPIEFALQMPSFLAAIFNIITLNFGWMNATEAGQLVRWICLFPLVAMFVWGVIVTFFGIFQRTA